MAYDGPGRYRGYKGGEYEALGVALREDSIDKGGIFRPEDDKGEQFVIYRPLTPGSLLERRREDFWARWIDDFAAMVLREHGPVPRFTKMSTESEAPTYYQGWVCPECGSLVTEHARAWVPLEFMQFCRHPDGPPWVDQGRNVERIRRTLKVVPSSESEA